jgi:hypothetical protein
MKLSRAVVGGLIGGVAVMAIVWLGGWASGSDGDLSALLGAVITHDDGLLAWTIGCVVQLVVAAVAAIVYAAIFEWVARRGGAIVGLVVAMGHVVVAGLAVGFLPVDGIVAAGLQPPAAFMEYRGLWVLTAFIVAHLLFGVIVGAMYGRTIHWATRSSVQWREVPR